MLPPKLTENCRSQAAVLVYNFNPRQTVPERLRQEDLSESGDMVYRAGSRTARATQRYLISKKKKQKTYKKLLHLARMTASLFFHCGDKTHFLETSSCSKLCLTLFCHPNNESGGNPSHKASRLFSSFLSLSKARLILNMYKTYYKAGSKF